MANADKLLQQVFNEHLNNLHTGMPGTVVELSPKLKIQPGFKRIKRGEVSQYPIIEDPPVLQHVEYVESLKVGDEVYLSFAERALDHVGKRRHDLRDAVVIGKF